MSKNLSSTLHLQTMAEQSPPIWSQWQRRIISHQKTVKTIGLQYTGQGREWEGRGGGLCGSQPLPTKSLMKESLT